MGDIQLRRNIVHDGEGQYSVIFDLDSDTFSVGKYIDVWDVEVLKGRPNATIEQRWEVLPSLWYTSPEPIIYEFSFRFRPNRIRKGSKQYLTIDVWPNVPNASDLQRYYENLAVCSPIKISISNCQNLKLMLTVAKEHHATEPAERY